MVSIPEASGAPTQTPGAEPAGHRATSVLLAALVLTMVLGNLRVPVVPGVLRLVGLDQAWDVFAPNPVQTHVELEASVLHADGRETIWQPPRASPVLAVRTYHWELWTRTVVTGYPPVADAMARWIATRASEDRPVRVTLRRRWYDVPAPASPEWRRWRESDFWLHTPTP